MLPSPEQIAKLPKWAQTHIGVLENNLRYAQARLAVGVDSNTWEGPYDSPPRPLGNNPTIRLLLGSNAVGDERRWIDVRRDIDPRGEAFVYVMASDSLAIRPQSASTARLYGARL